MSSTKLFRAVILGAPASGKGTISKRIVEKFNCQHIAPGDILRLNMQKNTSLGKQAKKYILEGKLVPDDLVIKLVLGRISEVGNRSWLLDGFPRTALQAQQLHQSDPIDAVIHLNVPTEVIVERASGRWIHLPSGRVYNTGFNEPKVPFKDDETGEDLVQRDDDKPEIIRKRMKIYWEAIEPVLNFYRKLGLLNDFGGKSTNEIYPKIEKFLSERTRSIVADRV